MSINLESFKPNPSKIVEPAKALGSVFIEASEKMMEMQMNSCKVYCDIVFDQMRKVPDIHNAEQAGDFVWGQIEPMSELNKQLLSDFKALMAFNTEFTNDVKAVFAKTSSRPEASSAATKQPEPAKKPELEQAVSRPKRSTKTEAAV